MRRELDPKSLRALRAKAIANGGSHKPAKTFAGDQRVNPLAHVQYIDWDVAGDCMAPVVVECYSRPSRIGRSRIATDRQGVDMLVRCRKCENCAKARAAHWRLRALAEYRAAPRSWLVTLTFKPEEHMRALSRARRSVDAQGVDYETLSADEQFDLLTRETSRLVTLYFKRLRKGEIGDRTRDGLQTGETASWQFPPASFRYMVVAEAHKSGLPHYHVLLHELAGCQPVRKAAIKRHWSAGFSDAKLVHDERAATYAAKYLGKAGLVRVRASIGYGRL